jgi:hypothetical protein
MWKSMSSASALRHKCAWEAFHSSTLRGSERSTSSSLAQSSWNQFQMRLRGLQNRSIPNREGKLSHSIPLTKPAVT